MRKFLYIFLIAFFVSAAGCKRTMLDERFYDTRLTGWTVVDDPDTIEGPSDWKVDPDGWLHQRSNIWGRRGDFLGRYYGTMLVAGDAEWDDYVMTVKTMPTDDDGFGVVFRFGDGQHFYRLLFVQDGLNGGPMTRLDKREGADYTELWSARLGFRAGKEMLVEVIVEGDSIQAKVDDRLLFDIKDSSYRRGKVGLFCYAQNGQAFDNVVVSSQ
jgi:hypothetical protein